LAYFQKVNISHFSRRFFKYRCYLVRWFARHRIIISGCTPPFWLVTVAVARAAFVLSHHRNGRRIAGDPPEKEIKKSEVVEKPDDVGEVDPDVAGVVGARPRH